MSTAAPEFVQSLARGLTVFAAFSRERPTLTLSEVAQATGLSRATARRLLFTLCSLGYASNDGKRFALTPKVLDIGYAYLSSLDLAGIAQSEMEALAEQTHESCSAAVLDGSEIVYVARVPTKRIMAISLGLGSRLPAYAASMGRVLLADLRPAELDAHLAQTSLVALTPRTIVDEATLRAELDQVRTQGWALVDQELEEGVRSVAAPLRNGQGRAVAALNVSSHAGRVKLDTLRDEFLPALLDTASRVSERLAHR
ncbi:MAG TPA: IclR family transcriptional regulator C-terminal domain-containing protein [Acidimicrobiales bacterium]